MAYGVLNRQGDDYVGFLADVAYETELTLKKAAKPENPDPEKDYPAWSIFATTPRGRTIPAGAGWNKTSKNDRNYISLKISINGAPVYMNAVQNPNNDSDLTIMDMGK